MPRSNPRRRPHLAWRLSVILALVLAACGGEAEPAAETTTTTEATTTTAEATTTTGGATTTTTEGSATTETAANGEMEVGEIESTTLRVAQVEVGFDEVPTLKAWDELERKYGIEVEAFEFGGTPDTIRALIAGEVDMVSTSLGTIISYAFQAPGDITYIVGGNQTTEYLMLSVPEITSMDQLTGGDIGTSPPGSYATVLTRHAVAEAGYDVDSFNWIEVGTTGARVAALAADQIDAAAAHAAEGFAFMDEHGLNRLFDFAQGIPVYYGNGHAAKPEWLQENPNLAQAYVNEVINARRWAMDNKEEMIEYSYTFIPEADLGREYREQAWDFFEEIGYYQMDGGMDPNGLQTTQDIERSVGVIDEDTPILDHSDWADPAFVERYLEFYGER